MLTRPIKRKLVAIALAAAAVSLLSSRAAGADTPAVPGQTYNLTDFGAVADGKTMNTDAFKKVIETASAAGGGRVRVPAGTYMTGPIQLLSNVDLHVEKGATVLFSRNFDDYPLVRSNWEGRETYICREPIWGENVQHVSITGDGVFDGQGDAWRSVKREKLKPEQWDALVKSGGVVDAKGSTWFPSDSIKKNGLALSKMRESSAEPKLEDYQKYRDLLRPELLLLAHSKDITFDGVTFRNSPGWNCHLLLSENITVHNVTFFNEAWAQNGDAIDVDSCRNVTITDSTIYAGDDDICLKSGRDEEGRKRGVPTENVTVNNCTIFYGHGGLAIGSEMSGGVRNVTMSNCIMRGTDIGLRFKTTRGRGGTVENINVSNIVMYDIKGSAILMDMYYMVRGKPVVEPISERTPSFRQFHFRNITCFGARTALEIRGLPELAISDITLEGLRLTADRGAILTDAEDILLRDVQIESRAEPALQTTNSVRNVTMERVSAIVKHGMSTTQPTVKADERIKNVIEKINEGDNTAPASDKPTTGKSDE